MSDTFFAYVDCPGEPTAEIKGCGTQGLTAEQYDRQLSNPWATWRCPCCGGEAGYNDELSERAQGITGDELAEWPVSIAL